MRKKRIGLLKPYGFSLKLQQIDRAIKGELLSNCEISQNLRGFTSLLSGGRRNFYWLMKHHLVFCLSVSSYPLYKPACLCLCLLAAFFPRVRSLSHVNLHSLCVCVCVCVCTCAANVKSISLVDRTGSIEHFCCWPLNADGLSCQPRALPVCLCLFFSVTMH